MPKGIDKKKGKHCRKFRIGPRKSGKGACLATTEQLMSVVESDDKRKYHSNAKQELVKRGITI